MGVPDDETPGASFASPPCLMHELDPAFGGIGVDAQQRTDVARWRKAERERLIGARLAMPVAERQAFAERIIGRARDLIGNPAGRVVSAYWPFRGEPDLRPLMEWVVSCGGRPALPVVTGKGQPLTFRLWSPGEPLERGVWNIPIPAEGQAVVEPDIVIAPVVGFDPGCFRLGYGGGFFDRTLAARDPRPRVLGVGYARQGIATIFPQPHDIPMDAIITEAGVSEPPPGQKTEA
ncbi:5-formyltetrahydrofolate cyclo-ligase [Amorphus coralli]|uniref:5-formyltetrahydrofolate cyclo-ligase n=1 Tax=Amorphus coralli TaxID=340680 RepID=UPI000369F847|nr:5-formyltetrahydrofolate cyclo-ligase [Amorphus coralli]